MQGASYSVFGRQKFVAIKWLQIGLLISAVSSSRSAGATDRDPTLQGGPHQIRFSYKFQRVKNETNV
jgi:hypothetical protein